MIYVISDCSYTNSYQEAVRIEIKCLENNFNIIQITRFKRRYKISREYNKMLACVVSKSNIKINPLFLQHEKNIINCLNSFVRNIKIATILDNA